MSAEDLSTVRLPDRDVPVRGVYDVVVAGGGLAGVSAAVAATEAGARTILVERNGFLGGVATAGMCSSVYNCLYTPQHELVVRGNSARFVDRLAEVTGFGSRWHDHRGHIIFDTEKGKLVLSDLLEESGADYLFDAPVTDVVMDGSTLRGVVIDSKSGKEALMAEVVVDATGDADIAHMAGVPLIKGSFISSYCFRLGNVDVDTFVATFADNPGQYPDHMDVDWTFADAHRQYRETGTFLFPHGGAMQLDIVKRAIASGKYPTRVGVHDTVDACQMHAIRDLGVVHFVTGFVKIAELDIAEISRAITDGKRMAYDVAAFFRKRMPGFGNCCVIATADDLGIRASRWIDGDLAFTREMKENGACFDDSIGKGIVERHVRKHSGDRAWAAQVLSEDTYDIPYRCLLPRTVDGLLMGSGRSVSQENPMLLRVMAMTMVVGQGAGAAAAVSARTGSSPQAMGVALVQEELRRQGVNL